MNGGEFNRGNLLKEDFEKCRLYRAGIDANRSAHHTAVTYRQSNGMSNRPICDHQAMSFDFRWFIDRFRMVHPSPAVEPLSDRDCNKVIWRKIENEFKHKSLVETMSLRACAGDLLCLMLDVHPKALCESIMRKHAAFSKTRTSVEVACTTMWCAGRFCQFG